MGTLVLAAGTSVPDALSSISVAQAGADTRPLFSST
jgi:Ca2+/Na+ antiporter